MDSPQFLNKFDDILNGNDVEALKTALQNLMLLFENQNRNYIELKNQVKNMKFKKPNLSFEKGDVITITNEEAMPDIKEGIVHNAYELLAAIRATRKSNNTILAQTEKTLEQLSTQEKLNNSKFSSIFRQEIM